MNTFCGKQKNIHCLAFSLCQFYKSSSIVSTGGECRSCILIFLTLQAKEFRVLIGFYLPLSKAPYLKL